MQFHVPVRLFAYDVIETMTMQIMINLPQILIQPIRPYNMSLNLFGGMKTNLNLFGRMKTEFRAKEVGELSIMLYGKMG